MNHIASELMRHLAAEGIAGSEATEPRLIMHERDARLAGVQWSRYGQWLFYARQRADGWELDVVNRDGSSAATVLTGLGPSHSGGGRGSQAAV
jgi:hypothetical protein